MGGARRERSEGGELLPTRPFDLGRAERLLPLAQRGRQAPDEGGDRHRREIERQDVSHEVPRVVVRLLVEPRHVEGEHGGDGLERDRRTGRAPGGAPGEHDGEERDLHQIERLKRVLRASGQQEDRGERGEIERRVREYQRGRRRTTREPGVLGEVHDHDDPEHRQHRRGRHVRVGAHARNHEEEDLCDDDPSTGLRQPAKGEGRIGGREAVHGPGYPGGAARRDRGAAMLLLVTAAHAHPGTLPHVHPTDPVGLGLVAVWFALAAGWWWRVARTSPASR